ncbi:virulence factor MviN [Comamonas sp. Y33R10-2]|uniref:virulence factor MviN n=1 Tax=Comamonas sp. Y33R10-2 TaxID=2853257 RepID=UPI001C5C986B|nr:virulence factor MviN [Comamonas sp. Y33R10-2]QXZ11176.1 virulence factor MviN [Comamonas sp. Y33R10-2]
MSERLVLWNAPQGKGLVLLMALFAWSGLMLAWGLMEMDFSGGALGYGLSLQAWMALGAALSLTMAWLLFQRSKAAVLVGWLYVLTTLISQIAGVVIMGRYGVYDVWSVVIWLLMLAFWGAVLVYLHFLRRHGFLR